MSSIQNPPIPLVLTTDVTGTLPVANGGTGQTALASVDHGAFGGQTDDDHTQYALLAGRSGGQTLTSGTGSGDDLIIRSTTNATKGTIFIEQADAVELASGTTAMELRLREPSGSGTNYTSFKSPALAANVDYTLPADDGNADEVLSTNGSGTLDWVASGGVTRYTPTLTDVDNTASETTWLSWSVPANTVADGDAFQIVVSFSLKNNQVGDDTTVYRFTTGGDASVVWRSSSWTTNASERQFTVVMWIQRVGTELWLAVANASSGPADWWGRTDILSFTGVGKFTTAAFTATETYALSITFGTASTEYYLHPEAAKVVKF